MFLQTIDAKSKHPISIKTKFIVSIGNLSRRTSFWDTAVPCGSEYSHNVVQLNPNEDNFYLLTPYPTLMSTLTKTIIRSYARISLKHLF